MNPLLLQLIKIFTPILAIINIGLIILFFFTYINRCNYHNLMGRIKDVLGKDSPEIKAYIKIFCDNSAGTILLSGFLYFFLFLINMAYCALLLIAFISSLVRLCQKNKCCLAASLYFFFSAIAGGLFDLILVFCNLQSLEMSDSFDDNLKHDVEEAYESVKDTRVVLVVSTLFAFLLSVLGVVFNYILLRKVHQEDNEKLVQNYNTLSANINMYNQQIMEQNNWNIQQPNIQPLHQGNI